MDKLALCSWLLARGWLTAAATLATVARLRSPLDGRLHLRVTEAAIARGKAGLAARLLDGLATQLPGIPRSAALLLAVIGSVEAPGGYGVIYRNRQHQLAASLTTMSLAEVMAAQPGWGAANGSTAAGRYQVIDRTLAGIATDLALDPAARFDEHLQDRIGYGLLLRRGFDRFIARDLPVADFAIELAREWAALPALVPVHGAHRLLAAGETWYAGDGRNRALLSPAVFAAVLERCLALAPDAGLPTAG
jgi:muramidase (phage lysozyme)